MDDKSWFDDVELFPGVDLTLWVRIVVAVALLVGAGALAL